MTNYVQVSLFSRSVWNFDQTLRVCVGLSYIHFDFQTPVTFTIPFECGFYGLFYGVTGFVTPPLRPTTRNPFAHAHSICIFFIQFVAVEFYVSLWGIRTFHSVGFHGNLVVVPVWTMVGMTVTQCKHFVVTTMLK